MNVSELLKDLPTHNRDNFTRLQLDIGPGGSISSRHQVTTRHRPAVYVPTKDVPSAQVIVTEKTNILLRYLHQQWDKKEAAVNAQRKREADARIQDEESGQRKKPRLDPLTSQSTPNSRHASAGHVGNGTSATGQSSDNLMGTGSSGGSGSSSQR